MDKKTIDTYNKMAHEYDEETKDFWEKFPVTFIDEFVRKLSSNPKILDIGSGPGRDGILLQKKGMSVTCLDASQTMVSICIQKGLNAIEGDFMNIPFEKNSLDGVWAYTSLLHVSKDEITKALFEIRRVLKDGGIFALGLIEGEGEIYKTSAGIDKPRLFTYYERDEIRKILKNAGFEPVYFEEFIPRSRTYLNFLLKNKKNNI